MTLQIERKTTVDYKVNMIQLFSKCKWASQKKKIYATNYSTLYMLFDSHIHCPQIMMRGLNPHTKF